jgi:hypothetical protein
VLEQIERKEIKGRVISIPAIAEENDPLGRNPGEYLWEEPGGYNYGAAPRPARPPGMARTPGGRGVRWNDASR